MNVKRFNFKSYLLFKTFVGGFVGLLLGLLYGVGGLIIDILISMNLVASTESPGLSIGTLLALGAIPIMPLIFACVGVVIGILELLLFKLYRKLKGKLLVEIE